ncbi:hypothetical protein [Arthrobacter sp. Z4-13]
MGTPHCLTVLATTRSEADDKLNVSIQQLRALAQENPVRGILVTRRGPGRFTVELNDQVPYGETWESVQLTALDGEAPSPAAKGN